jgi:ABC-type multidrug transport system fused ATPase/permease subunit
MTKEKKQDVTYFKLYRFATSRDRALLVVGTVSAMVHGAAMPVFSFIFGNLINNLTTNGGDLMNQIQTLSLYLLILAAVAFLASSTWNFLFTYTANVQAARCRVECFSKLLGKNISWFDEHPPAELPSRLQENVSRIQTAIGYKAGLFVMNISTFVAGYIIAAIRGWQLFLIILSVVPIIAVASAIMGKSLAKHSKLVAEYYAKAGAIAEEALNAIRTVFAFNGQKYELHRYESACDKAKEGGIKGTTTGAIALGVVMTSIFLSYSLAFGFGGLFIKEGVMNSYSGQLYQGGDVMTLLFSVIMGTFALGQAAPCLQAFAEGTASATDLFSLVGGNSVDSNIEDGSGGTPPPSQVTSITINNVSFTYPSRPEVAVLKNVSLKISERQKVAFVGSSGSGKSTLIALLERFYDPDEGEIVLNDSIDIRSLNVNSLRSIFGYVGQEPILFATTIRENLRYGAPPGTVSDKDMKDACRRANVLEFIDSLPDGLDTYVGPGGGTQISGGQKQRIAIARALLRNPQVLLLDEATSALDNESEKLVQETIDQLAANSSLMTISIAHRLSTIRNSDKIFVFAKGELVEEGKHDDLMTKDGLYSVLVATQTAATKLIESSATKDSVGFWGSKVDRDLVSPDPMAREGSSSNGPRESSLVVSDDGQVYDKDTAERKRMEKISKSYKVPWKRIVNINRNVYKWYIPASIACACSGVTMPLNAYLIAQSLSAFQLSTTNVDLMMSELTKYAIGYVGLAIGAGLALFGQWASMGVLSENFTKNVRVLIFGKLLTLPIAYYDDANNAPGKLCDMLSTNAMKMSVLSGQTIGSVFQVICALVAGITIAFFGSPKLAAVMLVTVPLLVASTAVQLSVMVGIQKSEDWNNAMRDAALIVSEGLQNIRTLRAFTAREWTLKNYTKCVNVPIRSAMKNDLISGVIYGASNCVIFLVYSGSFYYGGWLVVNDGLDFPHMIQALMGMILAATGAGQSLAFLADLVVAKSAAHDVFELLDKPTKSTASGIVPLVKPRTIEFRNVEFSYPARPSIPILRGLSFTVEAGQKIALVGVSGSGKSSVMALIQRFYEPTSGQIIVNGNIPLDSIDLTWWRDQIGYVGQEPVLFDLTLEENITYGSNAGVSHDQVETVARKANMDFVNPENVHWDTRLGPKGSLLSGGQKQRTAIARALARDPVILILDEATSALDSSSEAQVQQALDQAQEGRTTFAIAHRLSTIKDYDVIMVMSSGIVVESGTHEQLLNTGGIYRDLYTKGQQVK